MKKFVFIIFFLAFLGIVFAQSIGVSPPKIEINTTLNRTNYVYFTVSQGSPDHEYEKIIITEDYDWMELSNYSFYLKSCLFTNDCSKKINVSISPFNKPGVYTSTIELVALPVSEGGTMSVQAGSDVRLTVNVNDCILDSDCGIDGCYGNDKISFHCIGNKCVEDITNCIYKCENNYCLPPNCEQDSDCGSDQCVEDNHYLMFKCIDYECSSIKVKCDYGCNNGCYGECNNDNECGNYVCKDVFNLEIPKCVDHHCGRNINVCENGCWNGHCIPYEVVEEAQEEVNTIYITETNETINETINKTERKDVIEGILKNETLEENKTKPHFDEEELEIAKYVQSYKENKTLGMGVNITPPVTYAVEETEEIKNIDIVTVAKIVGLIICILVGVSLFLKHYKIEFKR